MAGDPGAARQAVDDLKADPALSQQEDQELDQIKAVIRAPPGRTP